VRTKITNTKYNNYIGVARNLQCGLCRGSGGVTLGHWSLGAKHPATGSWRLGGKVRSLRRLGSGGKAPSCRKKRGLALGDFCNFSIKTTYFMHVSAKRVILMQ